METFHDLLLVSWEGISDGVTLVASMVLDRTKMERASGCGKTSLAKLLCQKATKNPLHAHPVETKCTLLRGKQ